MDQTIGKWTGTGHIQQTAILAQETVVLYAREENGCRRYNYQTSAISSTRCDPKCIRETQVKHPPECKMIAPTEHIGYYYIR